MANYILNPYIAVVKKEEQYVFMGKTLQESETVQIAALGEGQMRSLRDVARASIMERFLAGEAVEQEKLAQLVPAEVLQRMEERGWLLSEMPDMTSLYARSRAFCNQYLGPGAWEKLDHKSVMVLGCGGIGTHLAWHLATWGVGRLVLVDFDTVEESNLNRQLLFDRNDIGKKKTTALKEKLLAINPELRVEEVELRISSERELERLLVVMNCDLVIKALDSPTEFPLWLDRVCKRTRQAYVAGITMQDKAMIGPTFLPGQSEVGLSDLLPVDNSMQKIHGTAPSLGLVLYHVSDELAVEAFKILTGHGTLKYKGAVVLQDLFSGQEERVGTPMPGAAPQQAAAGQGESADGPAGAGDVVDRRATLGCLLTALFAGWSLAAPWMWGVTVGAVFFLPHYLYRKADNRTRATFLFALVAAVIALIGGLRIWLAAAVSPVTIAMTLFFAFMGVGAILLVATFAGAGLAQFGGANEA